MSKKHKHKKQSSTNRDQTEALRAQNGSGKLRLHVHGTHCASCEVLIERKFRNVPGVESVRVNQATGKAEVAYSSKPTLAALQESLAGTEYSVSLAEQQVLGSRPAKARKSSAQDYVETGYVFLIVVILYLVLKSLNVLPKGLSVSDNMSYPFIFAIGLVAAVSSCIAVTGGLLVSVSARYAETHPDLEGWQKFRPQLSFNAGRVVGYTAFGGLVGALGSVFTLSTRMTGVLTLGASFIMVVLGCQLLNIFPSVQRLMPKMPKFLAHRVHDAGGSTESKAGPFVLGASTFFLPCGFTQALQLYVLSQGSFTVGALTMLAFSLGTLPALLSLSALSSFLKGATQRYFFRFAGVIVILLALSNVRNGLALAGTNISLGSILPAQTSQSDVSGLDLAPLENGKQVIRMKVSGYSYEPSQFKVRQGVPVEWHIDGTDAGGCAGVVIAPDLNLTIPVSGKSDRTVSFTPKDVGTFKFSCSMGMTTRGAAITVVPDVPESASPSPSASASPSATTEARATLPAVSAVPSPSPSATPKAAASPSQAAQEVQQLTMTVTEEKGFFPNTFTAKKGIPVVLTVDVQADVSGCMSTMIGSDYDIAQQLKRGKNYVRFTPTEAGTVSLTCPMGIPMGDITITD